MVVVVIVYIADDMLILTLDGLYCWCHRKISAGTLFLKFLAK